MKFVALFLVVLCTWMPAVANEVQRQATIAKIVEAQGLQEMFQQQIDQSQASAVEMGTRMFKKILQEAGVPEGKEDPRLMEAFNRYLGRCSTMFTAKEMVVAWSSFYGKGLSDADLAKILAYYQSSVGKKDVQASQIAMAGFTKVMMVESEKRMADSVTQLMSEIKAAMAK